MMRLWLILFFVSMASAAHAVQPNEMLSDPQLESRARHISEGLRCLVCQNQSIDDSDADLAHDLRVLVRQRLQAGDSDAAVQNYLVDRYGDYILLNPPMKTSTYALWIAPPIFLLVGIGMGWMMYRRRETAPVIAVPVTIATIVENTRRSTWILVAIVFVLVPVAAGITYSFLGSPELPAKPYAERKNDPDFILAARAEKLAGELETTPEAKGYAALGDIYSLLRHYDRAIDAYQHAVAINDKDANIWSQLGKAIGLSQNGIVVPEARVAFVRALQVDRHESRARFYMGLAEVQNNNPRGAVAIWRDLEKDSAPDAPWLGMVQKQIRTIAKKNDFDPALVTPQPPSLAAPDAATAIMGMNAADQNTAIRTMVDRLAERLKNNPDDLDGWERLAKSYRVLGENDKAVNAEKHIAALKAKGK